ncbi:Glutamine amidotransferases class-II [uncultured archaeon]|nr:Glutamine amidotransferases class-II [uncultured archaeon]
MPKSPNSESGAPTRTLYDPSFEHDSCGVGFVVNVSGERSHSILTKALSAVKNLTHRGAVSADYASGDGSGVLTQIPVKLFRKEAAKLGTHIKRDEDFAVGVFFMPQNNPVQRDVCKHLIEKAIKDEGLELIGWRKVPVNPSALGKRAAESQLDIQQVLVRRPFGVDDAGFQWKLYLSRKAMEKAALNEGITEFYSPSFSCKTIVYKGLVVSPRLAEFYPDLKNPDYETAFAIFHERYSTNTFPTWQLAQPFRCLGHNGEINTLDSNRHWTQAREFEFSSDVWGERIKDVKNVIQPGGSDSMSLDNVYELLVLSGRTGLHTMMMLIPEAHQNMPHMDPNLRSFYEYHACLTEPWDGPAALAFTDGRYVAAALDRNGLRPARYTLTKSGLLVLASEVGVVDIEPSDVAEKGRLGPGQMIAVDIDEGVFLKNDDIKQMHASRMPYKQWIERYMVRASALQIDKRGEGSIGSPFNGEIVRQQKAFGYTLEEIERIILPMAKEGKEPVGSMGDDTPLPVFSKFPRNICDYFKQRFAQVTNPPIDPYREKLVMSLHTALGRRRSILLEEPGSAKLIKFNSPILTHFEMDWIRTNRDPEFKSCELKATFPVSEGTAGLKKAVDRLCKESVSAAESGTSVLFISDLGVNKNNAPVPMLLAVSAVHHALIKNGLRLKCSIVVESGEPREDHHFACLLAYGANCIYPYLTYSTIHDMLSGYFPELTPKQALLNYRRAVETGILKIMSKMGVCTLSCYRGSKLLEAVGLSSEVIDECFPGTPSRIGGVSFKEIASDVLRFHKEAFEPEGHAQLENMGYYRFISGKEEHAFAPKFFTALHKAVRSNSMQEYKVFSSLVENRELINLRDLLKFKESSPVPIDEVESAESIIKRFSASAMSHGALSKEAHMTVAVAMNRLGAKSNSGEGGEDPSRYAPLSNGDSSNSAIKQVSSGRFGVTPSYLVSAKELEIKVAQGSKPGEGGQLPGHKVTDEIAAIRHSTPGVTLISPPPHHDIYSIEDLSQLIYDLKQVNPQAKVAVKLVSEAGIGTVAAGVAKAYADVIHVSGADGGTGASPLGSIKHAGIPWELGLAEVQQVLVRNDLRERVVVRVDGGLKTGRDVVIAALLGAEEYGFGTCALVAAGCVMARQCHNNNCPVGVASQNPEFRAKFPNKPEWVMNYMMFVANDVREILASLGCRSLDEIIGRVELLELKDGVHYSKTRNMDLAGVLASPDSTGKKHLRNMKIRNEMSKATSLDDSILDETSSSIDWGKPVKTSKSIRNINRTVGAKISGEIARKHQNKSLPEGTIECSFIGSAGQSFGAFLINGVRLILAGEANDYVGKGMNGGEIIVRPPQESSFRTHENVIVGNTVMYGATGGSLYAAGRAGERFCVRNSGGNAVIEGVGDHGCEYMTGGTVVILGDVGRNFGAGMTGGIAYVLNERDDLEKRINPQLIALEPVLDAEDEALLQKMIQRHLEVTGSPRAAEILENWSHFLPLFSKVVPHSSEAVATNLKAA